MAVRVMGIIENPTVLIYRRTHTGDPDYRGIFGCNDCMKSVRSWNYDAVIGIGGIRPETDDKDIAKKINWIGINPIKTPENSIEPLVTFSKFVLWDSEGTLLSECAPKLNKYMFEQGHIPRTGKYFPDEIYEEVIQLLNLAKDAPPSLGGYSNFKSKNSCKPRITSETTKRKCK